MVRKLASVPLSLGSGTPPRAIGLPPRPIRSPEEFVDCLVKVVEREMARQELETSIEQRPSQSVPRVVHQH